MLQGNRGHRPSGMLSWHRIQPPYRSGVLQGGARRGRSEQSDGTKSPGTILSHTPKKFRTPAAPTPADPADEQAPAPAAPALAGVSGRIEARACGVPTQGRGQRRSPLALLWQINLVVLDERCVVVCRTRIALQFPAEFNLRAGAGQLDKLMTWIGHGQAWYMT